ncbi:TadE/TadG family type IV pilus assembly protein [Bradyrhizobium sp.]|uniref:TadE/TadG family type IV pilus assembly protein n=1 Tax=Bradyrhizobium sp. TaxID=376 RepID=UPI001ED1E41F|nr:TadE/TadG family type IV pilus assembly protein [Bradyrhizobium sp.]MBV8922224.1 pilus assembly protein [Bradyrhizobium sp.]MBV9981564.1 pilus assembly protein [Bradyrhizobium sp.]
MTAHRRFERLRDLIRGFRHARDGNLAVIFALATIPVIGAIGAAVDLSKASDVKTQLQSSLDAAVLAGVAQPTSNQISTASSVFNGDFVGKFGTAATTSFVQNADKSLSGTASSSVSTSFLTVLGMSSMTVTAAATATPGAQATTPVCILLVNTLYSQALLVNSGVQLNAPSCEIDVLSTQSPAAIFNSTLNVKRICIKGSTIIENGGVTPPAVTNCPAISDPFAGKLPTVTPGTCIYQSPLSGNVTLNPGTYCGGVNFNGSGTLTLNSGLYVLQNGSMILNSGWTVNGTGVTFYFADQNSYIQFNSNVTANLSAPTTGTYANILMFEPTGLSNTQLAIDGTSSSSFTGLLYLPSREVTFNGISNLSSNSVTMVFSTLILDPLNWTIAPGALSMSSPNGAASSAYLSR